MHRATIELMHEQVRTIYRAATGAEMHESDDVSESPETPLPNGELERRFAELEALVRMNPVLGERVPPFSFTPLVDVIDSGPEVLVEIVAPGVERDDFEVEVVDQDLRISGVRRGERVSNGQSYVHAEIPRGPFSRVMKLPCGVEPRVDLEVREGLIRIRLQKKL